MQHLHLVLQRLQEYGLVLNMEKCELVRQEIDFLGHHITAEGASPILRHVQADLLGDGELLQAFHPGGGQHPPAPHGRAAGGLELDMGARHAAQLPVGQ